MNHIKDRYNDIIFHEGLSEEMILRQLILSVLNLFLMTCWNYRAEDEKVKKVISGIEEMKRAKKGLFVGLWRNSVRERLIGIQPPRSHNLYLDFTEKIEYIDEKIKKLKNIAPNKV